MQSTTIRRRVGSHLLVAALLGSLTVVASTVAEVASPSVRPAAAAPAPGGLEFTALSAPCRVADTRVSLGPLNAGISRLLQVGGAGSLADQGGNAAGCGVPDGAGAVEVAVTAVAPSGSGFLRAFATGDPVPNATFVNYTSGVSITNTGTVPLAAVGLRDLSVANFLGTTQVVVDVLGYFTDNGAAGGYTPLPTPCRAVDTRLGGGPLTTGASSGRNFQIAGDGAGFVTQGSGSSAGCGVPLTATAAVLSVTAVGPAGTGFLRVGPNTGAEPAATVVNYTNGTSITNTGAVPRGSGTADITLKNFGLRADVVVDVLGYYEVGTGTSYVPITPCRAVDTRFAPGGQIGAGATRLVQVGGERGAYAAQGTANVLGCGVPDRAAAVAGAVTAVTPAGTGFARLVGTGGTPRATFLNFTTGRSITNSGAMQLANGGVRDLTLRGFGAASHYVLDVFGYYQPPSTDPDPAAELSVGSTHSCRIAALQTVECWGFGGSGERGTPLYSKVPTPVLGVANVVTTTAGRDHSCAILDDGRVTCWGANDVGQLGNGGTASSAVPTTVAGITTAVAINASDQHTCVLLGDRTVLCWGRNDAGQLGDDSTTNRSTPVAVVGLSNAAALTSFGDHACALLTNGTVSCWGANDEGQLGNGTSIPRRTPTPVGGLTGVVAVSAGGEHTCALLAVGTARCWGRGAEGQLGTGTTSASRAPVPVAGLVGATAIATGGSHSCALLDDTTARCWGFDSDGQVGDGPSGAVRTSPTPVPGLKTAVSLDLGLNFSCSIVASGPLFCWGYNGDGTIGDGTEEQRDGLTLVRGFRGFVAVSGGDGHTCGVMASGDLYCWGSNSQGQLGKPGVTSLDRVDRPVAGVEGAVGVAVGSNHTCALLFDGSVRCWGRGAEGQLGNGLTAQQGAPVSVIGVASVVSLTAGSNHTCALQSDGAVYCWGANGNGQLGLGATSASLATPEKVSGASGAVAVDGGGLHTCAVLLNRTVRCWGANSNGQVGDSTTTQRTSPTAVTGLTTAVGITAGGSHSCAALADTTLKCWGLNGNGQLGDGTTTQRTSPATVFESGFVVDVAAGSGHTCATTSSGSVACWGRNDNGQLGRGSTLQRTIGEPASGLSAAWSTASGAFHTCAVLFDGGMGCWGDNSLGQLAVGDTTDRLVPTIVVGKAASP